MNQSDRKSLMIVLVILCSLCIHGQRKAGFPLSRDSFRNVLRFKTPVPPGRVLKASDIKIHHYTRDVNNPKTYLTKHAANKLLADPEFDLSRPTVIYAHGYLEVSTDESVSAVMSAYLSAGGYNVLLLDYSNLVYGDYLSACLHVPAVSAEAALVALQLVRGGAAAARLQLVGHSLGAHVLAGVARSLAARGLRVHRLSGVDPAYPLFYPPLRLNAPITPDDADFVDIIHTDGGSYGTPTVAGHADFWPNGGVAQQPGCAAGTLVFTYEDFCSHWRSWAFWAESVRGAEFLAVSCDDYDQFQRGQCRGHELVYMGHRANSTLRGNYYLRTAAKSPYALGERGVH